jgi:TonB-linked SusC/RagA family outer membrane protein
MLIDINQWDRNTSLQSLGNLFAQYRLTSKLQANARFGVDYRSGLNHDIQRRYQAGFLRRDVNSLTDVTADNADWTFNSTLNYAHEAGRHNVTLLGGFEAVSSSFSNLRTYREGFAIESQSYFVENAGTGLQAVGGDRGGYSLASFFGKADYDYADKYLATFTLREDGSSRFGQNYRYGLFPAVTLGWRLSKESFFPTNGVLSDVKLRYGWGKTGNQEIANNAQYALYIPGYGDDKTWGPSNGTAYDIKGQDRGTLASGFFRTQTGNPDLRWETTIESNGGADLSLFGDRVSVSLDYFDRTTRDILISPAFIATIGNGGAQWQNGATMKTRGAEATARYEHAAGGLTFGIAANVSGYRDKITKLPESVVKSYPGNAAQNILGHSVSSIFGYVVQGIFQDQAEVTASATQPGKAVGRLRYEDLNGDGKIDALDQTWLGTRNPKVEYGFAPNVAYKGLALSLFVQGVAGSKIYNGIKTQTDFTSIFTGANFGTRVLRAWTPQNRGSTIPALSLANTNDETRSSTYFVEDGSYLKLREVVLSYTIPRRSLPRALAPFAGGRLFARGGNLLTRKGNTTLPDPEMLFFDNYPLPRSLTVGLDLSF